MSTTIESLQLEISQNSQSAIKGIDALTQSLTKLRNATKGGLGLTSVSKQIQKATKGFSAFSKNANNVTSSANKMVKSNDKSSLSFLALRSKMQVAIGVIKGLVGGIKGFTDKSSDYIENVNLFTVAMGQYVAEAKSYANQVSEIMGIDPGDWMRNQGLFQTLITGFGVAGEGASKMSKNLTQLAYDLSSFYNIDVGTAMQKLKSGMAGELEPLRAIGYDLSQAKLEATAKELGIDKAVSDMTQAEKSMLRYHAIMSQVTVTHGDMARTLDQPANQMRILSAQWEMLSREIGNVFMPLLQKLLPYGIAVTKMLREMVSSIATFVGFEMPTVDTGIESLASGSETTEEALEGATEQAKKLKSYTMGIDELNVISPNEESDDSVNTEAFDIPILEYDFLGDATNEHIDGIITKIKELFAPIEEFYKFRAEWAKGLDFEPIIKGFTDVIDAVKPVFDLLWDISAWADKEIILPFAGWVIEKALPKVLNLIVKALKFIERFVSPIIDGLKKLNTALKPIVSWLGDVVIAVFDGFASIFEKLTQVVVENEDKLKGVFTGVGEVILAFYEIVKPLLDNIIPLIEDVFNTIGDLLADLLKSAIDILNGIVDFVAGILTGDWERAWDGFKEIFSGVWDAIVSLFSSAWEIIVSVVSKAWDGIVGIFTPVGEWFYNNVIKPVGDFFKGLWESVAGFFVSLRDGIKTVWNIVSTWFYDYVITPVVNFFKGLWDAVSGFFTSLWDGIKTVWSVVATWFNENIIVPVVNFFKGLWESISGFFVNLWESIKAVWNTVATWFNDKVIQPLVNFFAPIVEWISQFFYGCWLIIQAVWVVVSTWFNENVIIPVVAFFKGLWEAISGFFVSLWNDIVSIWNTVATWFNEYVIVPVVNFFKGLWESISGFFKSLWEDIVVIWENIPTWFNEYIIIPVVGFFKGLWETVLGFFKSLWEDIKEVWNKVSTWFDTNVIQPVVGFFQGVWTSVSSFFVSLWEDIKEVWNKVSTWFNDNIIEPVKTAFEKACEAIGKFFTSLWLGIRQGVANAMNGVISGIESAINWVISGINKLIGGFDKIVQGAADILGKDWGGLSLIQEVKFNRITVPTFAQGGFPDSGQAFIARENGIPEMVGTIGRRTAVANNDQIVESVASGVAEANNEQNILLREQNSLLRALLEKDTGVYLDGRSLSKSVDKFKNEQGRVIMGGAL